MYKIPQEIVNQYIKAIGKHVRDVGPMVVTQILPMFDLSSEKELADQRIVRTLEPLIGSAEIGALEADLDEIKIENNTNGAKPL